MRLSYILPVYNVEKYIDRCIESIFCQKMNENEFEVVCINDGSTDNSLQILEQFAAKYQNVRIITEPNGGLSRARNHGIQNAKGEYLFFVDSDDYIAHDVISSVLLMAEKSQVQMLFFDVFTTQESGKDFFSPRYIENESRPVLNGIDYFVQYFPGNSPCQYLIKKEFIVKNGLTFIEGRFCEDGMFTARSLYMADSVAYCHCDVYRYVIRKNSIITNKDSEHLKRMIEDFVYAIFYLNDIINDSFRISETEKFRERLSDRRNSYTFFLQVRMMKAKLDRKDRSKKLNSLRKAGCYPNKGLTSDYGKRSVFLSKVFQCRTLYNLLCEIYSILR